MDQSDYRKSLAAIGITGDKWICEYDGVTYNDMGVAVWSGIFGFCDCGYIEDRLEKIRELLRKLKCEICYDLDGEEKLLLYLLNKDGFVEHGCCITGSWLSDRGKHLLTVLERWHKDNQ